MSANRRKLVTIVTESALESRLTDELQRLGAKGYTVSEARGKGVRGARSAAWEAERNIRIEVVCDDAVARAVLDHVATTYYAHFAMIVFTHDVEVMRPEKF